MVAASVTGIRGSVTGNAVRRFTIEEATERVAALLDGAIRAEVFMLRDGELVGRLTVDPDVAQAALAMRAFGGPTSERGPS